MKKNKKDKDNLRIVNEDFFLYPKMDFIDVIGDYRGKEFFPYPKHI